MRSETIKLTCARESRKMFEICYMEKHVMHLHFMADLAREIMMHFNKKEMNRVPHAYVELLARVKAASKGLIKLVEGMEEEPELEFSAALVLRTMILDFFISLRGYDIKQRDLSEGKPQEQIHAELEAYFNIILGDGLSLTAKHVARMENNGHITTENLHAVLANMTVTYEPFLEPYANDKRVVSKYPRAPRNDKLFDKLCENPELKELTKHFEAYALYSKYEHFSIMSYHTFRRDLEQQAKTVRNMIEILALHTYQIIVMLRYYNDKDDFLKERHAGISLYIFSEIFEMTEEQIRQHLDAK